MAGSWSAQLIGGPVDTGTGMANVGGTATGPFVDCPGGIMVFACAGTFNGSTITLVLTLPDGVSTVAAGAGTTMTVAGASVVYLPPCQIRAVVTGGPPAGMFASIARVVG